MLRYMVRELDSIASGTISVPSDDMFSFFSCTYVSDNFIDVVLDFAFAHFAFAAIRSIMQAIGYFELWRRAALSMRTIEMRL